MAACTEQHAAADRSTDVADAEAERPLAERIYEAEQRARRRAARTEKAPPR
jgi:hypothetical protein